LTVGRVCRLGASVPLRMRAVSGSSHSRCSADAFAPEFRHFGPTRRFEMTQNQARNNARGTVLATRHVRVPPTTTHPKIRPQEGAERREAHPTNSAQHRSALPLHDASGAGRAADKCTQSAQLICFRGALAFRRSAAALARANASAIGSASVPAFPETRSGGRYPLRSVSSLPSSSETGRLAGRAVAQSRPRAECIFPRAGTAPAPSFESALAKGALSEQGEHSLHNR